MAEVNLSDPVVLDLSPPQKKTTEEITPQEADFTAGLTTGALGKDANQETFSSIREELLQFGGSTLIDSVKQEAERRKVLQKEGDLQEIVSDPFTSLQIKRELIQQRAEETDQASLNDEFERAVILNAPIRDENRKGIQDSVLDYFKNRKELPDLARKIEAEEVTYDPNNAIRDITTSFALPGFGLQIVEVLNEAMPGFAEGFDELLPGGLVTRFKEDFLTRDPKEQEAIIRKIAKAVEKNTFFGMNNGAIKRDIMTTLLGNLTPSTSEAVILNVISFLDLLALAEFGRIGGAAFKGVAKTAFLVRRSKLSERLINNFLNRKSPYSISSKLDIVDPVSSKKMIEDILDTGGLPIVRSGEDPSTLTQAHILAEPDQVHPTGAPSINDPEDEVLGYDGSASGFNLIETINLQSRANERMKALKKFAPTDHINKSRLKNVPGGVQATALIGAPESGFHSAAAAWDSLKGIRQDFKARIVVKDARTNELKPLDMVPDKHRVEEYYIEIDETFKYSAEDAAAVNIIRPDGITGVMAKYTSWGASLIPKAFRGALRAGDSKAALSRALSEKMAPITRMPEASRRVLEKLIDRGDQIGTWFSQDKLILEWGARKDFNTLVEGYSAFQDFQQATWRLMNDGLRRQMDGLNLKEVVLKNMPTSEQKHLGEVVSSLDSDTTQIFDPKLGKVRDIGQAEKELLEQQGAQFIRTPGFLRFGSLETNFILNVGDDAVMAINRLPDQVLKNIPGRLPRLYEATHIVKQFVKVFRNGK